MMTITTSPQRFAKGPTVRRILHRAFLLSLFSLFTLLWQRPARAQDRQGFQVNRYEPTAAGEWSFWVDHPWYSSTRYFAGGLTLNYAHNPLVFGVTAPGGSFNAQGSAIEHQLLAHVDLAGSFLDRVLVSASLPVTLLETGTTQGGVSPLSGVAAGDPRLGAMVRIWGQPYKDAFSVSAGAYVWIPINHYTSSFPAQIGESWVRVMPKVVLGGLTHSVLWSFTGSFYYRPDQSIGTLPTGSGNTIGSEVNVGAAVAYANTDLRFSIGPEFIASTVVTGGHAFEQSYTSIEALLGVHYNIARLIQVGIGGGIGILREPGTPDGRALLRIAYAPMHEPKKPVLDRDHDDILDTEDACPDVPGVISKDPAKNGCPPLDRDHDGVLDDDDQCPDVPKGDRPDAKRPGCPLLDSDGDGVYDDVDQCPDVPQGNHPDAKRPGCPLLDKDGDGVYDDVDQCIDIPAGPHPDARRPGCPDTDKDGDTIFDSVDQCPDVPAGLHPDPEKIGCPLPDRDHDGVPDAVDACPDKPGAPSPDPKKNGCPGLVEMKGGMIVILRQVFFATNKDIIQKQSFPVLQAVADTLKVVPTIKRVGIEGHTDNKGKPELNTDLSDRRAKSVMRWLVEHDIAADRLEAKGYGPSRPIADNATNKGRALNRRVEFHIVDPPQVQNSAPAPDASTPGTAEDPARKDKADKKADKAKGEKKGGKKKKAADKGPDQEK